MDEEILADIRRVNREGDMKSKEADIMEREGLDLGREWSRGTEVRKL